jgi:hypothetical protein
MPNFDAPERRPRRARTARIGKAAALFLLLTGAAHASGADHGTPAAAPAEHDPGTSTTTGLEGIVNGAVPPAGAEGPPGGPVALQAESGPPVAPEAPVPPAPAAAAAPTPEPAPAAAPPPPPADPAYWAAPIADAAHAAGLAPALVNAVVEAESAYHAEAVSGAGAIGLMQLMPETAAELGVDPHDPLQNLTGGSRYLARMLRHFGRLDLALAAYNAGPGRVARTGGIPPIAETEQYVTKILTRLGLPPTPLLNRGPH